MLRDKRFKSALGRAGQRLKQFAKAGAMVAAATAAAGAAALTASVKGFLSLGDSLAKMRDRTGLSVEALSELRHAATRSGTSLASVEKSVGRMQRTIVDAQRGLSTATEAFDALGINIDELRQMSPEQQFETIAASLAAIEDPTTRAGLAMQVFGRSGTQILPMVEQMDSLRQEARDLGVTMDTETAESAVRLTDMFTDLVATLKQVAIAVGAAVAPLLERALPVIQQFATLAMQGMSQMGSSIADTIGSAMGFLQDTVLDVLQAVSFAWNNWGLLVDMAATSAMLSVVRFANQTVYFFSEVIPGWLVWLADNWREIFMDMASLTATVASNIWTNLKNLWSSIQGLFSGEGFNFEWTPLTDGFESAIREWPKIAEREMGPLEKSLQDDLNKLGEDLNREWEGHGREFAATIAEFTPKGFEAVEGGGAPGQLDGVTGLPDLSQAKKDVFVSFSAAAAAAQAGASGGENKVVKQQEQRRKEAKEQTDRVIDAIENGGRLGP